MCGQLQGTGESGNLQEMLNELNMLRHQRHPTDEAQSSAQSPRVESAWNRWSSCTDFIRRLAPGSSPRVSQEVAELSLGFGGAESHPEGC